jgi:hypothetical protein
MCRFFSSGLAHCLASVILIHLYSRCSYDLIKSPRPRLPQTKSLGLFVPWTRRPLDRSSLGRSVPWTIRPLDMVSLDKTSLGRRYSWTTRPLDDTFLSHGVPDRCVLTLDGIDLLIVISYFGLGWVAYGKF